MKTDAIFHKKLLQHYAVINKVGTYEVTVANSNNIYIEDGSKSRYLLNLRAGTLDNLIKATKILGSRQFCPFSEVQDCFLTGTVWENNLKEVKDLPIKGEKVLATFTEENPDEYLCTAIGLLPRENLELFDLLEYSKETKEFYNLLEKYT